MNKEYLGDAVYVDFDPYRNMMVISTSERDIIFLEPRVYDVLINYVNRLNEECQSFGWVSPFNSYTSDNRKEDKV